MRHFSFTRQFDSMDCGPACIKMLARAYGRDYPLSYLRTLSHLNREGVSISGIRDALKSIGMKSASFEITLEQLRDDCPLPAILHWEQNHFVVLYDISKKRFGNGWKYHVANPAYGKYAFPEDEFAGYWLNGDKGVVVAAELDESFYERPDVKEKHSFIRFAKKYVWPFRKELGQLAVGLLGGILLSLFSPFITQAMVDSGIGMRDMGIIKTLMIAQICLFIGSFSMNMIGSWVTLYLGTRININILHDYLTKLLLLPMTFFETKSVGDYQQRIGDHGRLQAFTTQSTMQTMFSLLSCSVLLVIIGFYDLRILTAYLVLTGISTLWMAYFFRRRKTLDYERFRVNAKSQNKLFEMMNGIIDIKLNTYSNFKIEEWHRIQEELYSMSCKSLKLGQVQNTGYTLIGQVRNILITFWIAAEVVNGNLTLGMMMSISAIIGQVGGPLSQLIGFLQQFQDAKISLERSEEVYLCANEDAGNLDNLPAGRPADIEFRNVTFSYTGSIGNPVLSNVSFSIPAGKTTAIVGESGSGKTTLLKLLLKFYDPVSGEILIDGKNIKNYKAESIRENSGIVMQENYIFADSIKNNIILGVEYDEERLNRIIDSACLREYVNGLPLGINTKIGTEGIGVSGGEKQRIMIARAMYKRPMYMMLDEATSSLDAENERLITSNLHDMFDGRTMLVIAHRLSTVKNADNIIVLKHGRIVESGIHNELVKNHGYYYQLVKNQLELANEK